MGEKPRYAGRPPADDRLFLPRRGHSDMAEDAETLPFGLALPDVAGLAVEPGRCNTVGADPPLAVFSARRIERDAHPSNGGLQAPGQASGGGTPRATAAVRLGSMIFEWDDDEKRGLTDLSGFRGHRFLPRRVRNQLPTDHRWPAEHDLSSRVVPTIRSTAVAVRPPTPGIPAPLNATGLPTCRGTAFRLDGLVDR